MEKKKLIVNSNICDTRKVTEATMEAYESIEINSSIVIANERSRDLMNKYPVTLKSNIMLDNEEELHMSTINGRAEIKPGMALPEGKLFLTVNGELDVAEGSGEIFSHYCGIYINGSVVCPESLSGMFAMAKVNGSITTYPDGCIRLKNTTVLDRTFAMRAKEGARYFASRRVVALDKDIDFASLADKGVTFITKELLIAEGMTNTAVPLFGEATDIIILPDGCAYVKGDVTLDEKLSRRYGDKLYIKGNLTVGLEGIECLNKLTWLKVEGDVFAVKEAVETLDALNAEYDELRVLVGTVISDRIDVTVNREMLEKAGDGISVMDCVDVTIQEDIEPELIEKHLLEIRDCVNVYCTKEQYAAIQAVSEDVVTISDKAKDDSSDEVALEDGSPESNKKVVSVDEYIL